MVAFHTKKIGARENHLQVKGAGFKGSIEASMSKYVWRLSGGICLGLMLVLEWKTRLDQDKKQIGKSFKSKLFLNKSLSFKALDNHLKILSKIIFLKKKSSEMIIWHRCT